MADTTITIPDLGSLTAGQASDLLLATRGTTGYKMLLSDLAKYMVETYNSSSLAGSAQSVKNALDSLNSRALQCKITISDANNNLVRVVETSGNYIMSWTYPEDTTAYFIAAVHKSDGENPVVNVIANNKLTCGAMNAVGTIVPKYNDVSAPGVVCSTYYLG